MNPDPEDRVVIKAGVTAQHLVNFKPTIDNDNYQFEKIDMHRRKIETLHVTIKECVDASDFDLYDNAIVDIKPLDGMLNLVRLDLGNNRIKSFNVFTGEDSFPNLKWLNIANNKPTELPSIKLPKLEYLDVSNNKIEKVNDGWQGHANLRIIKAVDNKFKSLAVFKICPKLEELYVAQNAFTSLSGWESLPALKRLHCRRNKIEKVDEELPPLDSLEYLNLR